MIWMAEAPSNGSSPRVRGTGAFDIVQALLNAVHPRVCGEQLIAYLA